MAGVGERLGDQVSRYVDGRLARHEIRPLTAVTYREILWDMALELGAQRAASSVTRGAVECWMAHGGVGSARISSRLAAARGFFDWCKEQGMVRRNPCDGIRSPRSPRPVPRNLRHAQVTAVLVLAPDSRGRLAVTLGVQLGLRRGEMAALDRGDIDLARRLLTVREGKGGYSGRVLPIPDEACEAIVAYLADHPGGAGRLLRSFTSPERGISARHLGVLISRCLHAAGVMDGSHALRHTAASDLLDGGANIRRVQIMLGHVSMATTQRYLGWADAEDLRPDMEGRRYGAN